MYYGYGRKKIRLRRRDLERRTTTEGESRQKLPSTRFQRVPAQVQVVKTGEVFTARVFLHDLQPDNISVFLTQPIPRGEKVFLVIEHPRHIFVRGEIVWCSLHCLNRRVYSEEHFAYRAGIRFQFDDREEAELAGNYFKTLLES